MDSTIFYGRTGYAHVRIEDIGIAVMMTRSKSTTDTAMASKGVKVGPQPPSTILISRTGS